MQDTGLSSATNCFSASFRRTIELPAADSANWRLLCSGNPDFAAFLDDTWTNSWLRAFSPEESLFLCIHEGDTLVGLASLMRQTERWAGHPVTVLRSTTNNWSYRYEFIVRPPRHDVLSTLWGVLFTGNQADAIVLDWLPEDSPTLNAALRAANDHGWHFNVLEAASSPWRPLPSPPAPWDDGLKSKFKSNLRNREKRFNKAGKVTFEVIRSGDHFTDSLQAFYELEAMGWKGSRGTAILKQPEAKDFFDAYLQGSAGDIWLPCLFLDEIPVAAQIIRVTGHTMYLLKTAFNPDFSRYSPGQLITARSMQYGIAQGMRVFDFLGVKMAWKMDWAPELRQNVQVVFCSPSLTGRYVFLMRHGLKNQIKKFPGVVPFARWLRNKRSGK